MHVRRMNLSSETLLALNLVGGAVSAHECTPVELNTH